MKAWGIEQRGDVSQLKIFDTQKPDLQPEKILVHVKASSVNPADLKVLKGRDGGKFLHNNKFPILMGYDFAGTIESIGRGVRNFETGQDVFGFLPYSFKNNQGSFSEYLLVSPNEIAPKPKNIDFNEAASLPTVACTALQGLRDKGRVQIGHKVLVNGASGGVGTCIVQIAKIFGAKIWGTCSAEKMDFVKKLGVDQAFDYRKNKINEIPMRFNTVFDAASTSSFQECSKILLPHGRYITLLPSPQFLFGVVMGFLASKSCSFVAVRSKTSDLSQIARWVEEKRLLPIVDKTYPLAQLPEALENFRAGKFKGKIALTQ